MTEQPTKYGWPRYNGQVATESADAARKRLLPKLQSGNITFKEYVGRVMYEAGLPNSMNPDIFDANGYARRVDRGTYRRRLANRLATVAGVVMWCAVVVWIVWGLMA